MKMFSDFFNHKIVALFVAVSTLSLMALAHGAEEAGPITTPYAAEKISEHVYVIHGPVEIPNPANQGFMNNPGIIITGAGVVVIDPGSSVQVGRMVLEQVRLITDMPVVATFSTHIHGDHWLGSQAIREVYPEAIMYAHPDLIQLARDGEGETWVDQMMRLTDGATAGTKVVIPDSPVADGDVIGVGGIEFSIHHKGQAHTTSDIAIGILPDNTLFTGDLVFNKRLGRIDDGNFSGLNDTLDFLIRLDPLAVVPGHGQTSDVSIIENMKLLHEILYQTIEEKFEEGIPDFEIKSIVVEKLSKFSDWAGFEDEIGRMVSIGYLEVEENSF